MPGFRRHGMTGRRFGWFLDPEESADDIAFRVRHTRGVEPTADGWVFQHIVEPTMGLLVGSWRQALGERLSLRSDEARLDLSAERIRLRDKRAAGERDADTLIDLDPEIVELDAVSSVMCLKGVAPDPGWATWRDAAESLSRLSGQLEVYAYYFSGIPWWGMGRASIGFDTLAADPKGRALQATLNLYYYTVTSHVNANQCHVSRTSDIKFINADWGYIKTGYDSTPIGVMSSQTGSDGWSTLDITSRYAASSTFTLGLAALLDQNDNGSGGTWPTSANRVRFNYSAPYLELVMPRPGMLRGGRTRARAGQGKARAMLGQGAGF